MINDQKKQQARLSILEKLKQKGFNNVSPFPGNDEEPELLEEDQALAPSMEEEATENPGEESSSLSLDMVLQPKFLGKKKRPPSGR